MRVRTRPAQSPSGAATESSQALSAPLTDVDGSESGRRGVASGEANEVATGESIDGPGSLSIRVLDLATHVPIEGVPVVALRRVARSTPLTGVSNSAGLVEFVDILPGQWTVTSPLGGIERAAIEPGKLAQLQLAIAKTWPMSGTVRTTAGAPVSGAEIWVSELKGVVPAIAVAVTGSDGEFHIPNMGEARYIGASADGFEPSGIKSLESSSDRVQFNLRESGGRIVGEVRDLDGVPISDALLELIPLDDTEGRLPVPGESNQNGEFSFASVWQGGGLLRASAIGYSTAEKRVDPCGRTISVALRLSRGAVVHGTVTGNAGAPVPDALVMLAGASGSSSLWTRTTGDGYYRLSGLPSGLVRLLVDGGKLGRVESEIVCQELREAIWSPQLGGQGLPIAGVVINIQSIAGSDVVAYAIGTGGQATVRTARVDPAGRFSLPGLTEVAYRIDIRDKDGVTVARREAVAPGTTELLLQAELRNAVLSGTVLDELGAPLSGVNVMFARLEDRVTLPSTMTDSEGRFVSRPLLPGTIRVVLNRSEFVLQTLETIELNPDTEVDVGRIVLLPCGSARIKCTPPLGDAIEIRIFDGQGLLRAMRSLPERLQEVGSEFAGLPVGVMRVEAYRGGRLVGEASVDVEPHSVTEVQVGVGSN